MTFGRWLVTNGVSVVGLHLLLNTNRKVYPKDSMVPQPTSVIPNLESGRSLRDFQPISRLFDFHVNSQATACSGGIMFSACRSRRLSQCPSRASRRPPTLTVSSHLYSQILLSYLRKNIYKEHGTSRDFIPGILATVVRLKFTMC